MFCGMGGCMGDGVGKCTAGSAWQCGLWYTQQCREREREREREHNILRKWRKK